MIPGTAAHATPARARALFICLLRAWMALGLLCGPGGAWAQGAAPRVTVTQVVAGNDNTCAVTTTGAVRCWGSNDSGKSDVPADLPAATAVALGSGHTCALTTTGAVRCWGDNAYGQTAVPSDLPPAAALSAGGYDTCALTTAGLARCWGLLGNNFPTEMLELQADSMAALSMNLMQICALTQAGAVRCLGGATIVPPDARAPTGWIAIAQGDYTVCALNVNGAVRCWYLTGRFLPAGVPREVTPDFGGIGAVTLSKFHATACSILRNGKVFCWRYPEESYPPILQAGDVVAVSAGLKHTCALTTSGQVRCTGVNGLNYVPEDLQAAGAAAVSAGGHHACAFAATGSALRCWGHNNWGQAPGILDLPIRSVSSGGFHTCAIDTTGALSCWGAYDYGQTAVPPELQQAASVASVAAGFQHTCAVTHAGALRCWGRNDQRQITVPTSPVDLTAGGVAAVSGGNAHTCALTTNGAVRCWGDNSFGQTAVPTGPADLTAAGSAVAISLGFQHSCALTGTGAVRCWGDNAYGQTAVPTDLPAVAAVSAGYQHTCALGTAGAVRCWGDNAYGQATVPPDLPAVAALSAGGDSTCVLTTAGQVRCWGHSDFGQTDVPLSVASPSIAGQSLSFTPGTPSTPLRTLALGSSATLTATANTGSAPAGSAPITYATWTPDTCSVSGNMLTPTPGAQIGNLCGVMAQRAGEPGVNLAAAPSQLRLLQLTPATPTLTLAASPASGTLGQSVSFTATLGSAANPGGTVAFSADGAPLACDAAPTLSAGVATCTTSALTLGAHSITASYAGDASNAPATAAALAYTVYNTYAELPLPGGGTAQVGVSSDTPGCSIGAPTLAAAADALPPGSTAPLGVLRVAATGCAGATLTVSMAYPSGSLAGLSPYKFGPARAGATPGWFAHGSVSGDTVTYTVTDDGVGDGDTTTPGAIADPFAMLQLASGPTTGVPTLSAWG
ncbi:MAG: Ig-like domain repeat protein, partial [Caldilineaceae bacterium]|nr:Ig-like domain repeat protein [Caldilineaceae bacterium]